jgi:hypothetical protein
MTAPPRVLVPVAVFTTVRIPAIEPVLPTPQVVSGLSVGAIYGITNDLNVDATVLPLTLGPDAAYGNPTLGATYRFVREHAVEVGAAVHVSIGTKSENNPINPLELGLPTFIRIGHVMRFETGAYVPISIGNKPRTSVGLRVPVNAVFQLTKHFHLGPTTGVAIADFKNAGTSTAIPLGLGGGIGTFVGHNGLVFDFLPFFSWPSFLTPGAPSGAKKVHTNLWVAGVAIDFGIIL